MQYKTISRIIGLLLILFSVSMLPPLFVNYLYAESFWKPFLIPFILILSIGGSLWFKYKDHHSLLHIREGFLIVVLLWVVICFFSSLPFILETNLHHSLTDSIFETVSGITTTGGACFTDIDALPHAFLYYRQQLQFIGGMGIVVLAVAIFPMLGMGGSQLFKVESSGPLKDNKLTPRITQTAKTLWTMYCFMTIICALCYWYSGMDLFYAIGESFATISTGGFSMHDNGFVHYNSQTIEGIACLFMFIGAVNFTLHYGAFQEHSIRLYWRNEEFRFYFKLFFICVTVVLLTMVTHHFFQTTHLKIIDTLFIIISISTTTGFTLYPFDLWPTFVPILIIMMSLIGGCAGSTTGGLKMLRLLLIAKQSKGEFIRSLHPQAILTIKMDQNTVPDSILQSASGFAVIYFGLFTILILIFMSLGNDFLSSFSAIAAGIANSGAGVAAISKSFAPLSDPSKWLLIITMIIGRLEIYPLFILFTRPFWQK